MPLEVNGLKITQGTSIRACIALLWLKYSTHGNDSREVNAKVNTVLKYRVHLLPEVQVFESARRWYMV